jgi:ubiquitin C-terminal hydrolase
MDIDATSSNSARAPLAPSIPRLSAAQAPIHFTVCWARVNRSPWWPGKILTGADIPEELSKKRRTTGFQCVRLFNRDECNWVNPNKILEFSAHPDGPEERKRPPVVALAQAIDMARDELSSLSTKKVPIKQVTASTRQIISTTTKSNGSSSLPTGTIASNTMYQFVPANGTVPATAVSVSKAAAPKQVASAPVASRPTMTPLHAAYIQENTPATIANWSGARMISETPAKSIRTNLPPGTSIPEPIRKYVTVNGPTTTSALKPVAKATASAAKASSSMPPLMHPQAVQRMALASPMTISASETLENGALVLTGSRPSSKNGAKAVGAKTTSRGAGLTSVRPAALISHSPSPNSMDVMEVAVSAHSSRAPSPVRGSAAQLAKIGELLKPVEEFVAYKGSATVGHAIISKPAALSWSGSRTQSASVDSLTVVASVKQRYPDGQSTLTPKEERHFIGMQNLGNTCYINSAIQCLATVSTFCLPLISILVSLDDVFSSSSTSSSSTTASSIDESSNSRSNRRRGRNAPLPEVLAPIATDKKTRSRKSWCKYPDLPPHNPEDAKSNPLIASLVSILKTLSHPGHLIQHSDRNKSSAYPGRVGPNSHKYRGNPFPGFSQSFPTTTSAGNAASKKTSSFQHLIANSSDEDMDVDPIGDDDEENGDEVTATGSSTSVASSIASEPIPSKEVTKVLQAFQNSSGQLLDEKYYTDQHQDISEFILHLLEYTHDQLNTKKPLPLPPVPHTPKRGRGAGSSSNAKPVAIESPRSIAHAADYPNLSRLEMECKDWYHYMATNSSPISDSFDGLLRRKRTCPKGHSFTSYEIFRILTLHFEDENAKECTLEDLFHTLRKPEFLDCRCSECGGNDNKNFSQTTDVYILPKYLIVTLGRFKGSANDQSWWAHKIKTRVKFPLDNLDMAPLFDIAPGQPAPTYNLVAISNHKGSSIHGGHYFSYVRSFHNSEHWVCLNDTTVKEVRKDAIVSNQAYMLFYERQDK